MDRRKQNARELKAERVKEVKRKEYKRKNIRQGAIISNDLSTSCRIFTWISSNLYRNKSGILQS